MSELNRERVEALAEVIGNVPFQRINQTGCGHRLYGPCANCVAEYVAPTVAAWLDEDRAEGERRGADAAREAAAAEREAAEIRDARDLSVFLARHPSAAAGADHG